MNRRGWSTFFHWNKRQRGEKTGCYPDQVRTSFFLKML